MLKQTTADPLLSLPHTLSLVQQKIWNYMFLRACKNLITKPSHSIPIKEVLNYISLKKQPNIKSRLLELQNSKNFHYFQEITIIDNVIHYRYPDNLIKILNSKSFLSAIRSTTKLKFTSRYALILYELIQYMFYSKIKHISIESFRHYMGFDQKKYCKFKALHYNVINKALNEINTLSKSQVNINIDTDNQIIKSLSFNFQPKKNNQKTLASLKQLHGTYLESKAYQTYEKLPKPVKEKLEEEYTSWFKDIKKEFDIWAFADRIKKIFLIQKLISPFEQDFELWYMSQAHGTKKIKIST